MSIVSDALRQLLTEAATGSHRLKLIFKEDSYPQRRLLAVMGVNGLIEADVMDLLRLETEITDEITVVFPGFNNLEQAEEVLALFLEKIEPHLHTVETLPTGLT